MNVRRARTGDVAGVVRVAERSWEADYPGVLNRENVGEAVRDWYDETRIREELDSDDALLVVAEDAGEVVGFVHGVSGRATGHILRVYVAPDHRGEGVGSALLAAMWDSLLDGGAEEVRAMVLAANDAGNAFYRQAGFEKVDEGETTIGGETYAENVYAKTV